MGEAEGSGQKARQKKGAAAAESRGGGAQGRKLQRQCGTDLVKADDRPGVSVAAALVTRTG